MMKRWTMRARLTALYGGLFFLAGAVLLGVTYLLLQQSLRNQPVNKAVIFAGTRASTDVNVKIMEPLPKAISPEERAELDQKVQLAENLRADFQQETLRSLLIWGGVALGAVGAGATCLSWLIAGRTLRPIQQITSTAQRVAERNLHERIALTGPHDEVKELADTFDSMLERLDRSFDGQRRFVANASHELRTPLAINRTLLEVAMGGRDVSADLRQLGTTLLAVNARHERLIDGLLTLARSDTAVTEKRPVDVAEVAGHVVEVSRADARQAGVELVTSLAPAPTAGDPLLIERLALNLVQNAVRYNARAGWVDVTTHNGGDTVKLVVTNTGPSIPAYEVPGLFEPFRRLGDRVGSARGTGLGLSIVRSVARAHGGRVDATPREGGGLIVTVQLPVCEQHN
jgi:signal transduction histidine kinase